MIIPSNSAASFCTVSTVAPSNPPEIIAKKELERRCFSGGMMVGVWVRPDRGRERIVTTRVGDDRINMVTIG